MMKSKISIEAHSLHPLKYHFQNKNLQDKMKLVNRLCNSTICTIPENINKEKRKINSNNRIYRKYIWLKHTNTEHNQPNNIKDLLTNHERKRVLIIPQISINPPKLRGTRGKEMCCVWTFIFSWFSSFLLFHSDFSLSPGRPRPPSGTHSTTCFVSPSSGSVKLGFFLAWLEEEERASGRIGVFFLGFEISAWSISLLF